MSTSFSSRIPSSADLCRLYVFCLSPCEFIHTLTLLIKEALFPSCPPSLLDLTLSASSSAGYPGPMKGRYCFAGDIPFRVECSKVSHCLYTV